MNRRNFVKYSSILSGTFLADQVFAFKSLIETNEHNDLVFDDPVQSVSDFNSLDFNGDDINRTHDILWNVEGYLAKKGGVPNPTEFHSIVIAGGGMSGLLSAYHLQDCSPCILEQAPSFGGNSRGESLQDSKYSIGAAYVTLPDEGSDIDQFFNELNLKNLFKVESDSEAQTKVNKQLYRKFWEGVTDPHSADQFKAIETELRRIYNDAYPEIPWNKQADITYEELCELDNISFANWLTEKFGIIHPHIKAYFQSYCWSSFGGSIEELSAAQVLNFVCAEVDGVMALPGGNSAITQALTLRLRGNLPKDKIQSGAIVIKIKIQPNGKVWVTYENKVGLLKTIECDKVVCAFPKFVAEKVVDDLSIEQKKALENITYRGYIVSNVILDRPVKSPGFDIFDLDRLNFDMPSAMKRPKKLMTDVCFGSWTQDDIVQNSVLTMYRPLPFDGARQFLFSSMSHAKHMNQSLDEARIFLTELNVDPSIIKGVRLTRWGHSMPLAKKGMIGNGFVQQIKKPIAEKIYFVNQDNWVNPAFECCFTESLEVAKLIQGKRD